VPDYKLVRLAATLLFFGLVVFEVVGVLHPAGANDHQVAFMPLVGIGPQSISHNSSAWRFSLRACLSCSSPSRCRRVRSAGWGSSGLSQPAWR
jgi:hypothetical protein